MKLRHAAALALVACLLLPSSPRAAGPIAVPGTADGPAWYLVAPPIVAIQGSNIGEVRGHRVFLRGDTAARLSQWEKLGTFPNKKACEARRAAPVQSFTHLNAACILADDPRLNEK